MFFTCTSPDAIRTHVYVRLYMFLILNMAGTLKSTKDKQSKCFVCDLKFSKENKRTKQEWLFCDECNEWFHWYVLNFY
jgi:hypothetical protein